MTGKICHITTAHPALDNRIFYKECVSLAEAGYEVYLLVANQEEKCGKKDGVYITNVELSASRIPRILFSKKIVLQKALEVDADLYHFHDPELLSLGKSLKQKGKVVVYDSHEDVPRQILFKTYIPAFLRPLISQIYEGFENRIVRQLDAVVSPTPHIQNRFAQINERSIEVCNFPRRQQQIAADWSQKKEEVCYVGTLMEVRGIREMIEAMELVDARLNLAGHWWEKEYESKVKQLPGWSRVNDLGFINKDQVRQVLTDSKIGLVTLHPIESYQVAYAVKMFEYMASGIPVVASNFPLWEALIAESGCGICVDPLQPDEIAKAINYLLQHPAEAQAMGRRGQEAFRKKYNWQAQRDRLVSLYQSLGVVPIAPPSKNESV